MSTKLYWYSICFANGIRQTNSYLGATLNYVTQKTIQDAKENANMPADSQMTSCCYLGHMTKEEFEGQE